MKYRPVMDAFILLANIQNNILLWSWVIKRVELVNSEWTIATILTYFFFGPIFYWPYIFYILTKEILVIEFDRKYPGVGAFCLGMVFSFLIYFINILLCYYTIIKEKL